MAITIDSIPTSGAKDIATTYGLEPSLDGYYNSLMQYPDIKDRISNDWSDENGLEVLYSAGLLKAREFTLTFLCGATKNATTHVVTTAYANYIAFITYLVANPTVSWYDGVLVKTFILEYLACSSFNHYPDYNLFTIKVREANH